MLCVGILVDALKCHECSMSDDQNCEETSMLPVVDCSDSLFTLASSKNDTGKKNNYFCLKTIESKYCLYRNVSELS